MAFLMMNSLRAMGKQLVSRDTVAIAYLVTHLCSGLISIAERGTVERIRVIMGKEIRAY